MWDYFLFLNLNDLAATLFELWQPNGRIAISCCMLLQDNAMPSRWPQNENGSAPRWQSPGWRIATMMDGEQVRGCFELWSRLLTGVGAAGVFCCRCRCPLRRSCQPRQALSKPKMSPLGGLPHGSQVGPSQVDRTSSCDNSFSSQQGLCSLVFGLLCDSVSASCLCALARPPVPASRLPIHTQHFLVPKVPAPWTWRQSLFQPCQRVRRQQFPRPAP